MTTEQLQDLIRDGEATARNMASDQRYHDAGVVIGLLAVLRLTNASALARLDAAAGPEEAEPAKKPAGKRGPDKAPRRKKGDAAADAAAAGGKQVTVDDALAAKGATPPAAPAAVDGGSK